jgi:hypothetical protein
MLVIIVIIIIFQLLVAPVNLFSRFNVKLICSLFLSLSLSLISCLNLFYNFVINYEQFYVINLGNCGYFDNLSIDQVLSIYSSTNFISYLSLFPVCICIIMFIEYNIIPIKLINFFKIIIILC